jgi:hypothetical protein
MSAAFLGNNRLLSSSRIGASRHRGNCKRVALVHQTPHSASTMTHGKSIYMTRYLEKLFDAMPRVPAENVSR